MSISILLHQQVEGVGTIQVEGFLQGEVPGKTAKRAKQEMPISLQVNKQP